MTTTTMRDPRMERRSVVGARRMFRKPRAWLGAAAVCGLLALALVGADLLPGLAPHPGAAPAPVATASRQRPAAALLAGTPFEGLADRAAPSLADLQASILPSGVEPVPIPPAPSGPAPLRQALSAYAAAQGAPAPDLAGLDATLGDDASTALSRLLMSLVLAGDLQEQALAGLDTDERLLLGNDAAAVAAWTRAHPDAGVDGLEAELARLSARIDAVRMAQAGDLLVRAVELVRGPLSAPPAPPAFVGPPAPAAPAPGFGQGPWDAVRAAAGLRTSPPLPATITLEQALQHLAGAAGLPAAATLRQPTLLHPTLDHAIALLVEAHAQGLSAPDSSVHEALLLEAAEAAAPTLRAWGAILALQAQSTAGPQDLGVLLGAAVAPAPDAAALAAALRDVSPPPVTAAPPLAPLLERSGVRAEDAAVAAAALPAQAAAALALLLQADADLSSARAQAAASLDAPAQAALWLTPAVQRIVQQASWTPAEAALVEAWAHAAARLDPQALQRLALAQAGAVAAVAAASSTLRTPTAAPGPGLVPETLAGTAQALLAGRCVDFSLTTASSACDRDVLFQTAAAGGILVLGPGSTLVDATLAGGDARIVLDLGGDDVYRVAAGGASGGLGVPGDALRGLPLDGNVLALMPTFDGPFDQDAGTSVANLQSLRAFSAVIDLAGDDEYTSGAQVGQGAASGLGTVGLLWDLAGDDRYDTLPGATTGPAILQGTGESGGLGLLVDGNGTDNYLAAGATAQGVGESPILPLAIGTCAGGTLLEVCMGDAGTAKALAGTGALLDLGSGNDTFTAGAGQGASSGFGTVGLLLDQQGATTYTLRVPGLQGQGGRGPSADAPAGALEQAHRAGGLAALIDLGGPGDSYNAPRFPAGEATGALTSAGGGWSVLRHPSRDLRKGDDTVWANTEEGLAFGVDTGLDDSDGDRFADALELAAQSDPANASETPQQTLVESNRQLAEQAVGALLGTVLGLDASDSDGDGFPNGVEGLAGTDPQDPASRPAPTPQGDPGFLVTLPVLCSAADDDACMGGPCDATRDACMSLLSVGGAGRTVHAHEALVEVDLEGDDAYQATVAGEGAWTGPNGVVAAGSVSLDVSGDDDYRTPSLDRTQAFAASTASVPAASLLLDLAGDDQYAARAQSQAASLDAVALLADFAGNDVYDAVTQASHEGQAAGARGAALVDLAGDDHYRFQRQAVLSGGASGGLAFAVRFDGSGTDEYVAGASTPTGFEDQASADVGPDGRGAVALAVDAGDAFDTYRGVVSGEPQDLSARKNGVGLHANPASNGARAVFSDGQSQDADGDGVPSVVEALLGSDPTDPTSLPLDGNGTLRVLPPSGFTGLRLPGFILGGLGDDVYTQRADVIIDLGGDDQYLAEGIGGMTPAAHAAAGLPSSAALLLDLGGDDLYAPAAHKVNRSVATASLSGEAIQGELLYMPTLGAAVAGVSVLADQGGRNTFQATTQVEVTVDASLAGGQDGDAAVQVRAWGLTMGAALHAGFGALLSWDGSSTFLAQAEARAAEERTTRRDPAADAFTLAQGAVADGGIGILAAFGGGDDDYTALANATAPWFLGDGGRARAIAQGAAASEAGLGLLLDDGGTNRFTAPAGFAQGSMTAPGRFQLAAPAAGTVEPPAQAGPTRPPSTAPAAAVLWSGPGDDSYLGGPASQGASGAEASAADVTNLAATNAARKPGEAEQGHDGLGLLLDTGGNDQYALAPAPDASFLWATFFCPRGPAAPLAPSATVLAGSGRAACALSQGAAELGGLGLLLDSAGDDRYEAAGRTHVQGVGLRGGLGALVDATGNDVYEASGQAQGYAAAQGGEVGALLLDLEGRDAYRLPGQGQGYAAGNPLPLAGRWACNVALACPFGPLSATTLPALGLPVNEPALFADLSGEDTYDYGGVKVRPAAGPQDPAPTSGNGWVWTGRAPASVNVTGTGATSVATSVPRGLGVDAQGIDEASAMVGRTAPGGLGKVTLCVRQPSGSCLAPAPGQRLAGRLPLVAQVDPATGLDVERVTFLRDGAAMASVAGTAGDGGDFTLDWDTALGPDHVPDGTYALSAVAFLAPVHAAARGAAPPDALAVASEPLQATIDNAPTGTATLAFPLLPSGRRVAGVSPAVPATAARLSIEVGPGLEHPQGYAGPGDPGAFVNVSLVRDGSSFVLHDAYGAAGRLDLDVTGHCPATACTDGSYVLRVTLTDVAGQSALLPDMALFIDGTPPASQMLTPERANRTLRLGDGLVVDWAAEDDLAGVAEVAVARLDDDGMVLDEVTRATNGSTQVRGQSSLRSVASNETLRLRSVAADLLGNRQEAGSADVREVRTDFGAPRIGGLAATPAIARPGVPVVLSANVVDLEGALADVTVAVGGARDLAPAPMDGPGPDWVRQGSFTASTQPQGEETAYVFTVEARDTAGNAARAQASAMLDSRAPRAFLARPATYRDGTQEVPLGRPGAVVEFDVLVNDFKVLPDGVRVDGAALGLGELACADQGEGRRWLCLVTIPDTLGADPLPDGTYPLPLLATDAAGNLNESLVLAATVERAPPRIVSPAVAGVGPDWVELSWDTDRPALASVQYGKSSPPQRLWDPTEVPALHHVVRVTGLDPASRYLLRPVATSQSNAVNDTAALLNATTLSGYVLSLPDFPALPDWAGARTVPVDVHLLLGDGPVSLSLKLQDAARLRNPLPVAARQAGEGAVLVDVDTLAFADGAYRLLVDGSRQGDLQRLESPTFRIDNTPPVAAPLLPRPGGVSAQRQPTLALGVVDPLRQELPAPSSVSLSVDGNDLPVSARYNGTLGGQARLDIPLPVALADGLHNVTVRLADAAGNPAEATWDFRVDTAAPSLAAQRVSYGMATRGRPGGMASVTLRASDASGIANLSVDLRPWQGQLVPLAATADGNWTGALPLPAGLTDGLVEAVVRGTDGSGLEGPAGRLLLDVDAVPPSLSDVQVRAVGLTAVEVRARSSEAAVLQAWHNGTAAESAPGLEHILHVEGLLPGTTPTLRLVARDLAGNLGDAGDVAVTMPVDGDPPAAASGLSATQRDDGVLVAWDPASDNAGIASYELTVARPAGRLTVTLQATARSYLDLGAAAGPVDYSLVAIDVAGQRGPVAQAAIDVALPGGLAAAAFEPRQGPADRPFTVRVLYSHPAGQRPDALVLHYGNASFPLRAVAGPDCWSGCPYVADVRLPARSTVQPAPEAFLEAVVQGRSTLLHVDAPLVTATGEGFHAGGPADAPALPLLWLLAAVVAAVAARRGGRR